MMLQNSVSVYMTFKGKRKVSCAREGVKAADMCRIIDQVGIKGIFQSAGGIFPYLDQGGGSGQMYV